MATLKIITAQDKAAFLNILKKQDIDISTNEIENIEGAFLIKNLDDKRANNIKDKLSSHKKTIQVKQLKESIRNIVKQEMKEKFG